MIWSKGTRTEAFQARTYMVFGYALLPWTRHVRASRDLLRRAFEVANQTGELIIAAHCGNNLNTNFLMVGDPLVEVQREAEHGLRSHGRRGSVSSLTSSPLSSGWSGRCVV